MIEQQIAIKIKAIRKASRLTLGQLAERTALSKSFLSRVENCKVSPTITTLARIAEGLKVPLSAFLDEERLPLAPLSVVRKEKRRRVESPGRAYGPYDYYSLSAKPHNSRMEPFSIILFPDQDKPAELVGHPGEEIIFVISGKVYFLYGKEEYILNAGDTIHFLGHIPHKACTAEDSKAEVLSIIISPL